MKLLSRIVVVSYCIVFATAFTYADEEISTLSSDNTLTIDSNAIAGSYEPPKIENQLTADTSTVVSSVYEQNYLTLDKRGSTISLDIPSKVYLRLDPYDSENQGQVVASDMLFHNYSNIPVKLKLLRCDMTVPEGSGIVFPESMISKDSRQKEVLLYIKENKREETYNLKNDIMNVDFGQIEAGESITLNLGGEIGTRGGYWNDNDTMKLTFVFDFEPVPDPIVEPEVLVIEPELPPDVIQDVYENENSGSAVIPPINIIPPSDVVSDVYKN